MYGMFNQANMLKCDTQMDEQMDGQKDRQTIEKDPYKHADLHLLYNRFLYSAVQWSLIQCCSMVKLSAFVMLY